MLQRNSDLPYVIPEEPAARPTEGWQYPTVDLREMGRILRRRYKMALLPALILLGLAAIYLAFSTTLYTATSTVLVDPRRANVVETNQSVLSNFGTDDATIMQVDLGLVEHHQLVTFQCAAQLAPQHQPLDGRGIHLR